MKDFEINTMIFHVPDRCVVLHQVQLTVGLYKDIKDKIVDFINELLPYRTSRQCDENILLKCGNRRNNRQP